MTDIDNLSAPELKALAERADKLAAEREAQDLEAFRNRVLYDIKAAGYTVAEILGGHKPAKAPKERKRAINPNDKRHGPRPPKYRHPGDGRTWSGRGAQPAWFRERIAAGFSPYEMLIQAAP